MCLCLLCLCLLCLCCFWFIMERSRDPIHLKTLALCVHVFLTAHSRGLCTPYASFLCVSAASFSFSATYMKPISCRLASSVRPTTSKTVPKLTTPTTSTTLIIRANISRRGRNEFTADSVRRGLNTSIKFDNGYVPLAVYWLN